MNKSEMIVAGIMSGTSADGINVAFVRIRGTTKKRSRPRFAPARTRKHISQPNIELLGHTERAYPSNVRTAVLRAMNASQASVAHLSRLNFLLGELYSEAVIAAQKRLGLRADLIGCHGQTLYHQGERRPFLGRRIATTWQTGEAAIIAGRTGIPVVCDFRPADLAAGGKGAPLVPYFDYLFFRDPCVGRIVQNIGGIANLTVIPAGCAPDSVIAFDTGPGNMVIDALTEKLFRQPFDRHGKIAASGAVQESVIRNILRHDFFRAKPPKTAGREEFGREFVNKFLRACGRCRKPDVIATATALTAQSVADAVTRNVIARAPSKNQSTWEMIASGGGVRNLTLMRMLAHALAPLSIPVRTSDEFGLPSPAKEAAAFAVLAFETWHRRPSNVPSATGAKRPAILGKISWP